MGVTKMILKNHLVKVKFQVQILLMQKYIFMYAFKQYGFFQEILSQHALTLVEIVDTLAPRKHRDAD